MSVSPAGATVSADAYGITSIDGWNPGSTLIGTSRFPCCRHRVYSCFFSRCRGGETEFWGVCVLVKSQGYHLQAPETQKLGLLVCSCC